jgi:succinate dehydrogenase flavin-adding protein (antitoxin of CptAB toxin-antitoxin module)
MNDNCVFLFVFCILNASNLRFFSLNLISLDQERLLENVLYEVDKKSMHHFKQNVKIKDRTLMQIYSNYSSNDDNICTKSMKRIQSDMQQVETSE